MTREAEPEPVGRGDDGQARLDGYFSRCPKCGCISFAGWEIHRPRFRLRLCQRRRACLSEPVTQQQVEALTGISERDLLRLMYSYLKPPATDADRAASAEVERRLGMSPVRPVEAVFTRARTEGVAEALRILAEQALPAVPLIDLARVEAEHEPLRRGWGMGPLWGGTLQDATALLRTNLERERARADFHYFQLEIDPEKFCVRLDSMCGEPSRVFGEQLFDFAGYRLWRGASRVFLCAHENAVL